MIYDNYTLKFKNKQIYWVNENCFNFKKIVNYALKVSDKIEKGTSYANKHYVINGDAEISSIGARTLKYNF